MAPRVVQISRHKPRLPIMRVHDVGPVSVDQSLSKLLRHARQCGEAEWVVVPIRAVGSAVRITVARVEMRGIDREQVQPRCLRGHDARRTTEQIVQRGNHDPAIERVQHLRIARYHRTHGHTLRGKRARQCTGDIGETTCLDQRKNLRGHREDVERRHYLKRSSIG